MSEIILKRRSSRDIVRYLAEKANLVLIDDTIREALRDVVRELDEKDVKLRNLLQASGGLEQ